ncbi:MAG: hypothetical protein H7A49_03050 [Akkermansiaceae bacterium]|nr:hypothetical protein [Akkermansiaceae bacterium]
MSPNPISRLARVFDSQLVKVEDRVAWLDKQLSTFASFNERPLNSGLGFRASRSHPGGPDPSVTIDLGSALPLEKIFLIPAQREYAEDPGLFPKRFTIDLSNHEDFSNRTILFTTGTMPLPSPGTIPFPFPCKETARYVRLTVQEGNHRGAIDLFGLSEMVVISNGEPVSFGRQVSSVGASDVPSIWYPEALVDGRMPLGIWHNGGMPDPNPGDIVEIEDGTDQNTVWDMDLGTDQAIDRLVLFPYRLSKNLESTVLPESLSITLDGPDGEFTHEWTNPIPGSESTTPLMIPFSGHKARSIRITTLMPWELGNRRLNALSEIEVWVGNKNVASGLPVNRIHGGDSLAIASLTDGYTSDRFIIPVSSWLNQLTERCRIERELATLRPVHRRLSSRSELNATWGSAVVLGLTFLIPVFIVERRRLLSRDQLDQIRKRIASDLHDDIGSNLGSISLIARTARKDLVRMKGPDEIAEDLGEMETIARESSLAMRDIVWLLERRQDSIGDLVERMRETACRLLREIQFTVECESNKTTARLSLDAKRHLFLFYKEAIHNILKHSHANRVSIRLWDVDDKLALEISDNGVGLPDADRPPTVNKLRDRAKVLDGLLQIASSSETGTSIRLMVKRSHLTTHPVMS